MKRQEIIDKVKKGDYYGALGNPSKDKLIDTYMILRKEFSEDEEVITYLTLALNNILHEKSSVPPPTFEKGRKRKERRKTRKGCGCLVIIIIIIVILIILANL